MDIDQYLFTGPQGTWNDREVVIVPELLTLAQDHVKLYDLARFDNTKHLTGQTDALRSQLAVDLINPTFRCADDFDDCWNEPCQLLAIDVAT